MRKWKHKVYNTRGLCGLALWPKSMDGTLKGYISININMPC